MDTLSPRAAYCLKNRYCPGSRCKKPVDAGLGI
jgi:hypothetical protein